MTNREWIDLLSKEFSVSRASARDMLHAIMLIKKHDNFKRTFDPLPNKKNEPEVDGVMEELKPCPFCNGKAELKIVPGYFGYFKSGLSSSTSSGWFVKCLNGCCNQTPYTSDHDAVEAWNRRVSDECTD